MATSFFKTFGLLFLILASYCVGIFPTILAADVLTVKQYGLLNYLFTISGVLGSLIALGCDTSPLQFLNKYFAEDHQKHVDEYIHWSIRHLRNILLCCIITSLAIFFILDPLEIFYEPRYLPFSRILATSILTGTLSAIINIFSTYFLCDKQVGIGTFMGFMLLNLFMIIAYVFGYYVLLFKQDNLDIALMVILSAYLSGALASIVLIRCFIPRVFTIIGTYFRNTDIKQANPKWHDSAKSQLIKNLLTCFRLRIDFIVLGFIASDYHDLAFYGLASSIGKFIYVIPIGMFRHLIPEMSLIINNNQEKQVLQKKWNTMLRYNLILLSLIYAGILYFSHLIIIYLYGPNYLPAANILSILMTGYLFDSIYGAKISLMAYTGLANYTSKSYIIQLIIFTTCVLIIGHNAIQIAYSTAIALAITAMYCVYTIKKQIGFKVAYFC